MLLVVKIITAAALALLLPLPDVIASCCKKNAIYSLSGSVRQSLKDTEYSK